MTYSIEMGVQKKIWIPIFILLVGMGSLSVAKNEKLEEGLEHCLMLEIYPGTFSLIL